ncbi:PREDICTED: protein PHLOEM PROTEIN 2-LIKE A1-like [Tarenaya hassleriana]|uniref:protein PHLOEM PROTEIN 2-LIKE A1-like n=1 Tax=Tarenaya hassleriana TaxID=28532 RepID=UPI00053C426E|nr:PREDICTED: protein PHLOEM PROTEIN 2-LIKE A1-like [Tarenaya hassleriana]
MWHFKLAKKMPIIDAGAPAKRDGEAKHPPCKHILSPASADAAAAAEAERSVVRTSKLPHNCEAILRNAGLSPDKFIDRLHEGVFLKNKTQKYWVEGSSSSNCFMVYARDLSITWSENTTYWTWFSFKDTPNDTLVEGVELKNVCWLDISGKFETVNLTPGTTYEVVFVVKLEDPAYGWDTPVNVKLTLPSGQQISDRKVILKEKMRYQWLDIPAGEFVPSSENAGEIRFSMYEHDSGTWKKGLFVKGVAIRPKSH